IARDGAPVAPTALETACLRPKGPIPAGLGGAGVRTGVRNVVRVPLVLAHRLAHPPARVAPERCVERWVVSVEGAQEAGDALLGELAWRGWACGRDGARDLLDAEQERFHNPVASVARA